MAKRIRKSDDFYQESLIWMGYRFAIGISNCGSERCRELVESLKAFQGIEYDTPEFHTLAEEIAKYLKRKKIRDVVDLSNRWMERDLIWYSVHYSVGSHSYAGSHCHDIVRYGREVMSQERKEFMAYDIRKMISYQLNYPFNFHLPVEAERRLDPIDLLMRFMTENNIQTAEQLAKYRWIEVKECRDGSISYETRLEEDETKKVSPHTFSWTIDDLLAWDDLAKYFDPRMHKRCRVRFKGEEQIVEYFDSWRRKYGCEDEFPYEKLKRPVDSYERNPQICTSICEEYIVEDDI